MRHIPAFYFDATTLEQRLAGSGGAARFRAAEPFPHAVFDDFLPAEIVRLLIAEFPGVDEIAWTPWGPGRTAAGTAGKATKLGQSDERCFPPFIRHFMGQLLSDTFVTFVQAASGIDGLIVDPSHHGCGLHSTGRHGRLMIHTDVNRHPHSKRRIHQVLNLIVYLNDDWREEYQGHLELWTADRKPGKRILPIANRAVLFETGTRSFHGHPEPLACPEGRRRNSLAVYYYCLDRPPSQTYEGMQRHARWVPTAAEDLRRAAEVARRAETVSVRAHGRRARMPADLLPVAMAGLGEHDDAYLTVLHESALPPESRAELRRGRLAAMVAGDAAEVDRYYLLGFLSATDGARLGDAGSLLLACSRDDGALYLEHPETGRGLFYGYFEKLERVLLQEKAVTDT
ncbi:2OG-Fe(II) oxygenase [Actinoplanes sp. NPDC049599]|uniref:2OG-Fe(II) oxygenase n=1 Tax=Actinoplanes sp. NPDC049599 TaxID=3363903 RepID=UPI0037988C8E